MTWHVLLVSHERLSAALHRIRSSGGTIVSCQQHPSGVRVEWTTT